MFSAAVPWMAPGFGVDGLGSAWILASAQLHVAYAVQTLKQAGVLDNGFIFSKATTWKIQPYRKHFGHPQLYKPKALTSPKLDTLQNWGWPLVLRIRA